MLVTQKKNTNAKRGATLARNPNQKAVRKVLRTITDWARIATLTAAVIIAPVNAQALVAGGNFGKTVKKVHKHNSIAPASPDGNGVTAGIIPASIGGMARSATSGIYTASSNITTNCFKPRLVSLLNDIHHKYHRPVIVTSGYRGAAHNVRAGGVRGSLHLSCNAADIKVPGVNKQQLASYVRSMPNRGGVGLYCHQAVHVDIGTPREWNWCKGRKK